MKSKDEMSVLEILIKFGVPILGAFIKTIAERFFSSIL